MRFSLVAALLLLIPPSISAQSLPASYLGRLCAIPTGQDGAPRAATPVTTCSPVHAGYHSLASVGSGGDVNVNLQVGYDQDSKRLCFTATGLPEAPVLRVGVGHTLAVQIVNTLQDTDPPHQQNTNCPIDSFGGEGLCLPKTIFPGIPGADGPYYKLMANEAHTADGTVNLHVHGLFVPPVICSDEVLASTIYPSNWFGPTAKLLPCQASANSLAYTYHLPFDHPAGAYWYHAHRHGQSEHETQMGLAGAIVVEDEGDAYRNSIGVTDEVLLVTDTPITACLVGPSCDAPRHARQANGRAARAAASAAITTATPQVTLDPRVDQVNQAGECAAGASDASGGTELWTLLLNGATVPEAQNGFPPDNELLQKSMQPGQRQIFRLVNASANSFLAPELVLSQNGVETVQHLEVFARDGVGLADATGQRHFGDVNVETSPFIVPPAGRVEFVVHAPPPGATLYLQSRAVLPGCGGNAYPARRLLIIKSAGASVDPGAADDSDLLVHTPSMAHYLSTLGTTASVQRTFVLAEYNRGFTYGVTKWLSKPAPTTTDYDPSQTDFYITETASTDPDFNPALTTMTPFTSHTLAPQVTVHLHGQQSVTEEWLIENSTLEIHAFHMHQIHFRDITTPSTNPDDQPLLDVINVPAAPLIGSVATGYPGKPGWVRLRMTFTKADLGEFVFHCHILEHEDNGMMGKIRVLED